MQALAARSFGRGLEIRLNTGKHASLVVKASLALVQRANLHLQKFENSVSIPVINHRIKI
jgi:hypothetical protein